jgi:integrase/recombinase XerD
MRVGAAQDLAAKGRDIIQIMRAGGWKSTNVVGRYVEHASLDVWD